MKDFKVKPAYEPVVVCFASDDGYAPYLWVADYSMLCNRNRERCYDILILHKDISEEHQQKLRAPQRRQWIDASPAVLPVEGAIKRSLSAPRSSHVCSVS